MENATLADYGIFPEPFASATWQAAVAYITQNAGGSAPPTWMKMEPNTTWTGEYGFGQPRARPTHLFPMF